MNLFQIQEAAKAMRGVLVRTPIIRAPWLEKTAESGVYLKLENFQLTSSFKTRGALTKFLSLKKEEYERGVVAMSAGNHAQGVAYHAQRLKVPATIVMPQSTPVSKIERTLGYGAQVILWGNNLTESGVKAIELSKEEGLTLIHPYDDEKIITGQGTVGLEMLEDLPDLDVLIVPIGGGGLAAGVAIAAKAIKPSIKIYGVQSMDCPAMAKVLYPDRVYADPNPFVFPLAEGILVKSPGIITREILKEHLTDILVVGDEYVELAISRLLIQSKVIAEGAGGIGVGALIAHPGLFKDQQVGIVVCGGNLDARIISSLLMRDLVHQGKLIRLEVQITDMPGALSQITEIIGDAGGNIFELIHQRHFSTVTIKMTNVDIVVETRSVQHSTQIVGLLNAAGFPTSFRS